MGERQLGANDPTPQQPEADDAPRAQTQRPRPTWGEQAPDLDRQRGEGGGGTSSDSDGQRQDEPD